MKTEKQYFPEIDLCRGIGILFVVLGHALKQTGEGGAMVQALLSVIYSFHMPLFFVLSGFVSVKLLRINTHTERLAYAKDRAYRLLIPYFVVGILYMPLKYMLSKYALKPYNFSAMWRILIGDNPNAALWYVYILFWVSLICVWILTEKTLTCWLGISLIVAAAAWYMDIAWKLPKYSFFFILGIFLRVHNDVCRTWIKKVNVQILAAVIFVIANAVMYRKGWTILTLLTALSGTVLCFGAAHSLLHYQRETIWKMLGTYSMDIYIFSEPIGTVIKLLCWSILHLHYAVVTLLCFLLGLVLPIPISRYIIRKVKVLRTAFLGMH